MTLYRATIVDTPGDPFVVATADALRAELDGGLLVRAGVIAARGAFRALRQLHPDEPVDDLSGGLLLPGFVDTHVHFPQIRAMGGLGLPLLDWLEQRALPEECRLSEPTYALARAEEFLACLSAAGTTSALVFGAHHVSAMQAFFGAAERSGLNITAGLVVGDRRLPSDLLTSPAQAQADAELLIDQWHGRGRLRYAITPRFALSASDKMLAGCGELMSAGLWFTTHINENRAEMARVADLFPDARDYLDTYERHGLITERSVLAHNAHASDSELKRMAAAGAWTAHCPTSNAALGSGLFPLRRHVEHGVRVALGSDVGAGTGLFLPKEALQAYFMQQLLGHDGYALTPAHLLYLATRAGADALGLADQVGDFEVGHDFDAVWLRPSKTSALGLNLEQAADVGDALGRVFALASGSDIAGVWSHGRRVVGADQSSAARYGAISAAAASP
jgi:guanine deaminase